MRAKWTAVIKTVVVGGLGGGIAATVAMISDPAKYRFPHDLGTGKAWPFFITGAATGIGGMLLQSPFGQQMLTEITSARTDLKRAEASIAEAKAKLKDEGPK